MAVGGEAQWSAVVHHVRGVEVRPGSWKIAGLAQGHERDTPICRLPFGMDDAGVFQPLS